MIYLLENNCWNPAQVEGIDKSSQAAAVIRVSEIKKFDTLLPVNFELVKSILASKTFSFDRQENIDYMGFLYLNHKKISGSTEKMVICVSHNLLVFIHDSADHMESMVLELISEANDSQKSLGLLMCNFMERLVEGHIKLHENIEDEISNLENSFLTSARKQGPGEILILRKRLIILKRYYEQLQNILDDIQENEYSLIDEHSMRYFTVYTRRIERLYQNILILRDNVTQVRESYEAETGIKLNNIMRIFTVVTVIFLPLTLIAGWYGMNLQMPEFGWIWSYPVVILVCIAVVVFSVIYFKKNKWF